MAKAKLTKTEKKEVDPAIRDAPTGRVGGMLGHAMDSSSKAALMEIREDVSGAILRGEVSLEIPTDQIDENPEVGSDRVGDWQADPDLETLVENIRARGQTQPIRVRPADKSWRPDSVNVFKIKESDRFVIQSGRRRLEACRRLGMPVLAHIVVDIEDLDLADLEERYFENTMRKDLTGFERLLSIGSLARKMEGMSQREIAKRLGVTQQYVSGGVNVVEFEDEIEKQIDVSTARIRDILALLPDLKSLEGQGASEKSPDQTTKEDKPKPAPARKVDLKSGGSYRIRHTKSGVSLNIKGVEIPDDEAFDRDLAELLNRY